MQGKTSTWSERREKTFLIDAKLNEKNVQALAGEAAGKDEQLGMATPTMLGATKAFEDAQVKSELPSLNELKELQKPLKNT